MTSAEQYRSLIVTYRNGSPVRLRELGKIIDSVEDDKTASWFSKDGKSTRAIVLGIQRQPGTNTIAVTDSIKQLLPQFQSELPPGQNGYFVRPLRNHPRKLSRRSIHHGAHAGA